MSKPKSTPTGETKLHPGNPNETIMLYDDGAWRYDGNGEKTKGALAIKPAWLTSFNKETGLAAREDQLSKMQEDYQIAVQKAAKGLDPEIPNPTHRQAIQFMHTRQAELGMSPDVKGSTGAAAYITKGYYGGQATGKEDSAPKIEIKVDGAFIQAIQHVRDRHTIEEDTTIEGDFVDSD